MDKLQPLSALVLTKNLAENWRRFMHQLQVYRVTSGLARKDGKVQAMTLLHMAGLEALEVYHTFQWASDCHENNVNKIMKNFER